jgi:hypothetical protein
VCKEQLNDQCKGNRRDLFLLTNVKCQRSPRCSANHGEAWGVCQNLPNHPTFERFGSKAGQLV